MRLTSLLILTVFFALGGFAQTPATIADQMTTQERLQRPGWWPTSGTASHADYAGTSTCSECHFAIVKSQSRHSMAKASVPAGQSEILRANAASTFKIDSYEYKLGREANGGINYSVADEGKAVSGTLAWAFGAGKVGQSYISEENKLFHELRFSYFETLKSFGVTPNQSPQSATTITKAVSRVLSAGEAERCFGCHTTASKTNNHFDASNAMAGISCEGCHGPGAKHAAAMKAGDLDVGLSAIANLKDFKPVDRVDFCGACHTTWWDAKGIAASGVANVRFQPYRLESSRCWGKGDARLTCTSCHNPHAPLVREVRAYDERCLSCHSTSGTAKVSEERPGTACPVAKQDCVSCHMPKYEVPDMHFQYTDHRIRVVKAGEKFPN